MAIQNFLNPTEFRFTMNRLPNVEFFVQSVQLPDLSSGATEQATPFKTIYRPGDKLTFGDLTLTCRVDEDMLGYIETWNWLIGITKPESFDQYKTILEGDGLYSDGTLTVMTNGKNPNIQFTFKDMFPTNIGGISLAIDQTDVEPPTMDLTFRYSSFTIKNNL